MTTLLLFSLPWGYLIAALFLLIAIILFVIAIFMKDTGTDEEGVEDARYGQQEDVYENASYEDTFDRYQNVTDIEDTKDTLQDMIAETSEDLSETRMFTPVVDIPQPEPYEEPVDVEDVKEEAPEEIYEAPISVFGDFAEPEEDADVKKVEEAPVEDEFEEIVPPKKSRFGRPTVTNEEDDVPKPIAKQKGGMSFAEEVRRLIEEEERRNRNS